MWGPTRISEEQQKCFSSMGWGAGRLAGKAGEMWASGEKPPQLCPQLPELNPGVFHHLSKWLFYRGWGQFLSNLLHHQDAGELKVKLGET